MLNKVENIVAKGEIVLHEQFLLWPQCFQKLYATIASKCVCRWERVKNHFLILTNFDSLQGNDLENIFGKRKKYCLSNFCCYPTTFSTSNKIVRFPLQIFYFWLNDIANAVVMHLQCLQNTVCFG